MTEQNKCNELYSAYNYISKMYERLHRKNHAVKSIY